VTVDLTKIPANVKTKQNPDGIAWEEVDIDAGIEDSATRLIGWSRTVGFTGVIYLSEHYMKKNKLSLPPPHSGHLSGKDYEFMTVLYSHDSPVNPDFRFYGFHARITKDRTVDKQVLVSLYHAGTSQDPAEEPHVTSWVDLSSSDYDVNHPSCISKHQKEGALFIERNGAKTLGLQLKFPGAVLHIGSPRARRRPARVAHPDRRKQRGPRGSQPCRRGSPGTLGRARAKVARYGRAARTQEVDSAARSKAGIARIPILGR
jgi:hypothetical protein